MKNKLLSLLPVLLLLAPFSLVNAISGSQVTITSDGSTSITSAKVMQIAGSTFYTRLYWGDSYVRLLIKTTTNTKFFRGTGEPTTVSEIYEGNTIDASGMLESGSENMILVATSVKNTSIQKQQTTLSGTVVSVDTSVSDFVLNTKTLGVVNVNTSTTTIFIKGSRTLDLQHIRVGDVITKTSGDYDLSTKTLSASLVTTYVDPNYYQPKNFEGTLQGVTGTTLPTSIKMSINGISYTVNLASTASIMNKNRNTALLSRFVVGDDVRIYGAIREVDDPIIDASIVRNMNL